MLKVLDTPLADLKLMVPTVFGDERGFFLESWHEARFKAAGISQAFVQDNHSRSTQWTLRGMHLQVGKTQGKLVRVVRGNVFDAVVDLRRSSPSFGQWWGVELSEFNHHMLWVPPGFAHGLLATSDTAELLYKCTDYYSPDDERTLAWDDPTVAIRWPLPANVRPLLSAKDSRGIPFRDIEKFP